jgi:hypothetical protein
MIAMDGSRDLFLEKFFSRIPRDVAASFTPEQLGAVKLAFGARSWGAHAIDVRKSFPLFRHRIYLVLLMGRERRDAERLRAEGAMFGTLGNAFVTVLFLGFILAPLALGLYLLKSVAGLDVMPGDGFHGFWDNLARQIELALR